MPLMGLLISWTWLKNKKFSELGVMSLESSKNKKESKQRIKKKKKKGTDCPIPRTVGQIQKCVMYT